MNIKLNKKIIKIAVAALALITTTTTAAPTTITNLTTVSAKAKKHHKKVKKTKKKTYVIAKYYDEFKPCYSYTYNKKKHCYIGHKMSKKERQQFNMPKEQKIQKAKSNYDVPKISKFNDTIADKYDLSYFRWSKTKITINYNNLSLKQQEIAQEAINQINDLDIVKLVKTNGKANITLTATNNIGKEPTLGLTNNDSVGQTYKNLDLLSKSTITLCNPLLEKHGNNNNYDLLVNNTIIHEIGHALGLKHTNKNNTDIMAPHSKPISNDNLHSIIDRHYINGLAILYQN